MSLERLANSIAAATCPGLPWTVLAATGTVESGNGTSTLPGVHSGANSAGAEGPMQFEPATFATYDQPVPPGGANPPSPYDPTDAVYAAARDLCANGAANGANLAAAVYAHNHASWYVTEVLDLAHSYGQTQAQTFAAGTAGGIAVDWALAQVGTPYVWGGETPVRVADQLRDLKPGSVHLPAPARSVVTGRADHRHTEQAVQPLFWDGVHTRLSRLRRAIVT